MRRLLSPFVCGLHTQGKHDVLNDSMHSINSYDSAGSIPSDSEQFQLFDFSSQELVEEMTLIDKELLARIPWEELSVLGWMSSEKFLLAPNVMKMVQFFNRVAMLVTSNVLDEESTYRRAKVIKKAIKLAFKCRNAKNYNSLKAVLGGLQCTPVFRLKATWKEVPSRYRRMFRELSELMSEDDNFANYRKELRVALLEPPCIPFLGIFLTEVAHTHAFQAMYGRYRAATLLAQTEPRRWNSAGNNRLNESETETESEYKHSKCESELPNNNRSCLTWKSFSCGVVVERDATPKCFRARSHSISYTRTLTHSVSSDNNTRYNTQNRKRSTQLDCRLLNDFCTYCQPRSMELSDALNSDLRKHTVLNSNDHDNVYQAKCLLHNNVCPCFECKAQSQTDLKHSFSGAFQLSLPPNGHIRNVSDASSNQETLSEPALASHTKIHSRTDSDDSGVVLNTNKRYSNYGEEDLESPRGGFAAFSDDYCRKKEEDAEDGQEGVPFNDPLSGGTSLGVEKQKSVPNIGKLGELECRFGKLQVYAIAYHYISRPYVRHYLLSSEFNNEETSYKLSLKREPP